MAMQNRMRRRLVSMTAPIFGVCCCVAGCNPANQQKMQVPSPTVTVAQPVVKQIVEWDAYTGRLEAIEFVEIRARVSGYLKSIHFDEGQIVTEGDLLFVIDPRPYVAELNGANASLSQSESQLMQAAAGLENAKAEQRQSEVQLQLAESRIKRARSLKEQNAVSLEELDQREAEFQQAQADIEASKAGISSADATIATAKAAIESANSGVETAELNLDYTKILAPVTGRISRQHVTSGNLVSGGTATSTLLTTITSVDPIYCTFDANEQDVLKYTRLALAGKRESSRVAKNPVFMRARCVFHNDDGVLVPGMFARIRIPGSAAYDGILIPDAAIGTDQSSQYVYVVAEDVVERRAITPGPMVDGLRVVRKGLTGNEMIVIEGLLQARPDLIVKTNQGSIEVVEDGLPDTYLPLPPESWISAETESQSGTVPSAEGSQLERKGNAP
jgi:multidrug efflux pump subunit AcrA (membrane-fusion protein)